MNRLTLSLLLWLPEGAVPVAEVYRTGAFTPECITTLMLKGFLTVENGKIYLTQKGRALRASILKETQL